MQLDVNPQERSVTAALQGEIDHHNAREIREKIDAAVNKWDPILLNLDFAGVTFMDSSGIGLIMGRYRLMESRQGHLSVVRVPERLKKLMLLAGISKLHVLEEGSQTDRKEEQ